MDLEFAVGYEGRPSLGLPSTRLVNVFTETTPAGPQQAMRARRPGLTQVFDLGVGPILAVLQEPGFLNGDLFTISGSEFYRNGTLVGTVAYSNTPQMAASPSTNQLAIVSGGGLYIYDGTTLTPQTFFNDGVSLLPPLSGVSVLFSIFIYPQQNSNVFFFSETGDASNIPALNFSSAEVNPDLIVQSYVLAEQVYFFKNVSVEIWNFVGNLTAPFQLNIGATYSRGCIAQATVRKLDNSLFFVGDDFQVYRTAGEPQRISTSLIEDRLKADAANITQLTSLILNITGHSFYILNLPGLGESWAYDVQTQKWFQWGAQTGFDSEPGIFPASVGTGQGNQIYFGSYTDGRIWQPDIHNGTDDGTPIQTIVSAAVWISEGVKRVNNISLHCVRGVATASTPDPIVEMRWSDDGGRTWHSWVPGRLGSIGAYKYKATWRRLGIVKQPGRVVEFRISDPIIVAVEGASVNAARV